MLGERVPLPENVDVVRIAGVVEVGEVSAAEGVHGFFGGVQGRDEGGGCEGGGGFEAKKGEFFDGHVGEVVRGRGLYICFAGEYSMVRLQSYVTAAGDANVDHSMSVL